MTQHSRQTVFPDRESLARPAGPLGWLIGRSPPRRPGFLPFRLHADLGLAPRERDRDWSGWRPFG